MLLIVGLFLIYYFSPLFTFTSLICIWFYCYFSSGIGALWISLLYFLCISSLITYWSEPIWKAIIIFLSGSGSESLPYCLHYFKMHRHSNLFVAIFKIFSPVYCFNLHDYCPCRKKMTFFSCIIYVLYCSNILHFVALNWHGAGHLVLALLL